MKLTKDERVVVNAVAASVHADDTTKARAAQAARALRQQQPFVYNAFLVLHAAGARPTEAKILSEAKRLQAANDAFFAGRSA